jgi:Spy/CpxP family protein refolding chaperone
MWNQWKPCAIVASVALNVAFVAMWIAHAAPSPPHQGKAGPGAGREQIWCPLHRELGVTAGQWVKIEPRLRGFQTKVGEIRQEIERMRTEMIDLIAAEEPDVAAVRDKQDEILSMKRRIQRLVVGHLLAEKEVLTPGQQKQLFAMLRDRAGCPANPPMSGQRRGGHDCTLQHRDATNAGRSEPIVDPATQEAR